ncbi:mitochondrial carrier domain-containing protein [Dimargaris cristalligena]|uniref:Mitochondrial glycine transporter n=1 Tax=Dimargaris cristalligena TaxID=215637 RepID=A0A4Q0A2L8_9FUNG|nr:mitochondrial carrier domain-containing protein [Dimargaris cristalligena]|eukprot:RKP40078.1 mitochondrial carrier domain-containing protein [Dimargaris cristalligena]
MSATNAQNVSPIVHFLAGGVSGFTSCVIVQPALYTTVRKVVSTNGVLGLWRGTWPTVIRNAPGSAAYFAMLNQFKQVLAKAEAYIGVHPSDRKVVLSNTSNLIAGSSARALVGFILMPITVIKVRYESNFYNYNSLYSATKNIIAQDGYRGFFSGYIPTVLRDAPYAGLYIAVYEQFKLQIPMLLDSYFSLRLPVPATGMAAGMLAGISATLITQPFDMIKTRMQLKPDLYRTMWQAARVIVKDEGFYGFFRGAALRVARKAISTSISWTVYEELLRWDMRRQAAGSFS